MAMASPLARTGEAQHSVGDVQLMEGPSVAETMCGQVYYAGNHIRLAHTDDTAGSTQCTQMQSLPPGNSAV